MHCFYPRTGTCFEQTSQMLSQQCTLVGVWDGAEELRGSVKHTALVADIIFWVQNYTKHTQNQSFVVHKNKISCACSTGKPSLDPPKTESLRGTFPPRLLEFPHSGWCPGFFLCLARCLCTLYGLLWVFSYGFIHLAAHPWDNLGEVLGLQLRKASLWLKYSDVLHKAFTFRMRDLCDGYQCGIL